MEQKHQVVGEMCNFMRDSPVKAPIWGTVTQLVQLVLSFLTQGDLNRYEHMLW
jgi:hypothetical protein